MCRSGVEILDKQLVTQCGAMPISMLEVAKRVDQLFMEKSPVHDTMRRLAKAMKRIADSVCPRGRDGRQCHRSINEKITIGMPCYIGLET